MMLTRCPACATLFRLAPEHLKARQGRVRCGQCAHVFNAIDSLVEAKPETSAPLTLDTALETSPFLAELQAPEPTAEPAAEFTQHQTHPETELIADFPDDLLDDVSLDLDEAAALHPDALATDRPQRDHDAEDEAEYWADESESELADDFASAESVSENLSAAQPDSLLAALEDDDPYAIPDLAHPSLKGDERLEPKVTQEEVVPEWQDDRVEPVLIVASDHVPADARVDEATSEAGPGEHLGEGTAAAVFAAALESTDGPEHQSAATPQREAPVDTPWAAPSLTPPPAKHSKLWLAAGIVLGFAAILQGIYVFRTEVAAQFPEVKPLLSALCVSLNCDLPLPRKVDLIGIETSDLHPDNQGRPQILSLSATLRNRAAYAQAYPNLELTLTDADDKTLVRRVLLPREYLTNSADEAKGIAANGDLALQVNFDTGRLAAAGYRLYLYYP